MSSTVPPVDRPVAATRRRRAALGALLVALVLAWGLPAAPAAAAACDGVSVRVERSPGSVVQRCVTGSTPGTGLQALERAGFRYTFVTGQPGMVCTIDGHPDPCNDAPDDAYWAYWHADAGATSWTYSSRGAGNRGPAAGGHEAWVYAGGMQRPPSSPPAPPAPAPTPTPTPSPTTPPSTDGSKPGNGSGNGSGSGSTSGGGSGSGTAGGASNGSGSGSSGSASSGSASSSSSGSGAAGGASSGSGSGPSGSGATGGAADRAGERSPSSGPRPSGSTPAADDGTTGSDEATADDPDGTAAPADRDPDRPRLQDPELATEDEVVGDRDQPATAVDDPEAPAEPIAEADTVAIGEPAGGRSLVGVAVGGTLVAGLAGAAVLRSRRRGTDLGSEL